MKRWKRMGGRGRGGHDGVEKREGRQEGEEEAAPHSGSCLVGLFKRKSIVFVPLLSLPVMHRRGLANTSAVPAAFPPRFGLVLLPLLQGFPAAGERLAPVRYRYYRDGFQYKEPV
jgi:hypothetical protein